MVNWHVSSQFKDNRTSSELQECSCPTAVLCMHCRYMHLYTLFKSSPKTHDPVTQTNYLISRCLSVRKQKWHWCQVQGSANWQGTWIRSSMCQLPYSSMYHVLCSSMHQQGLRILEAIFSLYNKRVHSLSTPVSSFGSNRCFSCCSEFRASPVGSDFFLQSQHFQEEIGPWDFQNSVSSAKKDSEC